MARSKVNPFTGHGHLVDGFSTEGWPAPNAVARCGGPAMCGDCARDAERIRQSVSTQEGATVEVPYTGSFLEADNGCRVHTYADLETGRVRLSLIEMADADLTPEQAAILAVNLLRDRSLLVNGSG